MESRIVLILMLAVALLCPNSACGKGVKINPSKGLPKKEYGAMAAYKLSQGISVGVPAGSSVQTGHNFIFPSQLKSMEDRLHSITKSIADYNKLSDIIAQFKDSQKESVITSYNFLVKQRDKNFITWYRLGVGAAGVELDSIATDCFWRCSHTYNSPSQVYDVLKCNSDKIEKYIPDLVNNVVETEFCRFSYEMFDDGVPPLTAILRLNTLDSLAQKGDEKCVPLLDVMKVAANRKKDAYSTYTHAFCYALEDTTRYKGLTLYYLRDHVLQYLQSVNEPELIADILEVFQNATLQNYVSKDFEMAYTLFLLAHTIGDSSLSQYCDICIALDENKFMDYYWLFYKSVYECFVENPAELSVVDYLIDLNEYPLDVCYVLSDTLYDIMFDETQWKNVEYCDEADKVYKSAILYIVSKSDSIAAGEFSPIVACNRFLGSATKALFEDTSEEGCSELMALYNQLYALRDSAQYRPVLASIGVSHAEFKDIYIGETKEAEKMMKKMLPIIEQCEDEDFKGAMLETIIGFYNRHNKKKQAAKIQKLLNELAPSYVSDAASEG